MTKEECPQKKWPRRNDLTRVTTEEQLQKSDQIKMTTETGMATEESLMIVGRGGALVDSMPFDRKGMGSNPALTAM